MFATITHQRQDVFKNTMKIMTVSYSLNDFELPETIILLTFIPKQRKKVT